jgi:hypothetical protein
MRTVDSIGEAIGKSSVGWMMVFDDFLEIRRNSNHLALRSSRFFDPCRSSESWHAALPSAL